MKSSILALALTISVGVSTSVSAQTHAELQTMVQQLQANPSDTALREGIIRAARALRPAPAIPEEARRAFVQATTIAKSAQNASGQALAVESFKEALRIAPWWGEAWYNLAVAQELAGQPADARTSLKLYLETGPSAQEVREVQDHIYVLEAKERLATNEAANAAAQQAAKQAADQEALWNGLWRWERGTYASSIRSEKTGGSIRFLTVDGLESSEFIRGRVEPSGQISWEVSRGQACRVSWVPVRVTMSADSRTLSYDFVSYDYSECRVYEIVPVVLRRQ